MGEFDFRLSPSGKAVAVAPSAWIGSVTNLTTLSALDVTTPPAYPDGTDIYVATTRCKWRLLPVLSALDPMTVRASTDPARRWHRLIPSECEPGVVNPWLGTTVWGIAATGNDEAAGTPAAPLATLDEFMRRIQGATLDDDYTVQLANPPVGIDLAVALGPRGSLLVDCQSGATLALPVPALPVTILAFTAAVPGTPEWCLLTTNTVGWDWTPYLGKRCRITVSANPLNVGGTFWVAAPNPTPVLPLVPPYPQARISTPVNVDFAVTPPTVTPIIPLPGDTFVIEDLPTTTSLVIHATKAMDDLALNPPVVESVSVKSITVLGDATGIANAVLINDQPAGLEGLIGVSSFSSLSAITGRGRMTGCYFHTEATLATTEILGFDTATSQDPGLPKPKPVAWTIDYSLFGTYPLSYVNVASCRVSNVAMMECLWQSMMCECVAGQTRFVTQNGIFDIVETQDAVRIYDQGVLLRTTGANALVGESYISPPSAAGVGYGIACWVPGTMMIYDAGPPLVTGVEAGPAPPRQDLWLTGAPVLWGALPPGGLVDAAHLSGIMTPL